MRYGSLELMRFGPTPGDFDTRGPQVVRSFTRQFLEILYVDMSDVAHNVRDIYNLSRSVDIDPSNGTGLISIAHCGFDALSDTLGYYDNTNDFPGSISLVASSPPIASRMGIVVGTSSTAVGVSDYRMEGHIVHGTGGNQLIHYGTWGYNLTVASGTASVVIERVFRQDSNGSVTINEMGLYAAARTVSQPSSFCIVRDVLGSPLTISSGQFLRATYTFQVSE